MINDMRQAFEMRRLSFETYLETAGKSERDIRHEMRDSAVQNVKTSLVLGALADAEKIEVSSREVEAGVEDLLRGANFADAERRRLRSSSGVRSNVRTRIRRQRAIQKL